MSKDPAFLFYPNDFIGGTLGMTLEEKGAYLELLILQFNGGAFTEEQARRLLRKSFTRLWPVLREKFFNNEGKYLNERLEIERDKRIKYSESRRQNRKTYVKDMSLPCVTPVSLHMGNENENIINTNKVSKPIIDRKTWFDFLSVDVGLKEKFLRLGYPETEYSNACKDFHLTAEGKEYPEYQEYRSHFINWMSYYHKTVDAKQKTKGLVKPIASGFKTAEQLKAEYEKRLGHA